MANPYVPDLPEAAQARLAAARDLLVQGRSDEVQRTAADLIAAFPDTPQVLAMAGQIYAWTEDDEAARPLLDRAVALAGDDFGVRYQVGAILTEDLAEHAAALDVLAPIREVHPREVALLESAAYRGMGDYPAALEALDRAADAPADTMEHIADWPDLSEAVIAVDRAGVLLEDNQPDAARAAADAALMLYGDRSQAAEALVLLAYIAERQNDRDAAARQYAAATERDPLNMDGWLGRIRIAISVKESDEVLDVIHQAMEHHPTNPQLVMTAVMLLSMLGDSEGVVEEWDRLLDHMPDNALARAMRGGALLQTGRYEEAESDALHALRLDPGNSMASAVLAQALIEQRRLPGALAVLERGLAANPDDVELLVLRSTVRLAHDDLVGAGADAARAVRLRPDHATAQAGLGHVQLAAGQFKEALVQFRKAHKLKPDDPTLHYNVAMGLAALDQCDEAVATLRQAAAQAPELLEEAETDPLLGPCLARSKRRAVLPIFPTLGGSSGGQLPRSQRAKGNKRKR